MGLKGRVALIAGAADGVGLAAARRFAREGAKLVLADTDEEAGEALREELAAKGTQAVFAYCDVAERLDVHNLIAAALDAFDRVDVLVNDAWISEPGDALAGIDEAMVDLALARNVKGAFLAAQAAARQMAAQIEAEGGPAGRGASPYAIVNVSSIAAIVSTPDRVLDSISAGAVNQMTRAFSVALAPLGIRVNAVGVGSLAAGAAPPVLSDGTARDEALARTPMGRVGTYDEIAAIVSFLAGSEASYVTGQCVYADGGRLALNYTLPPRV